MMDNSSQIQFFIFLFCFVLVVNLGSTEQDDECQATRCGHHGPSIRFPFWVKDRQPDHCGFPGFELSCTVNNHTVLELPPSVKLFVKDINYKEQRIDLYDPDGCLPGKLTKLNLTASPIQFIDPPWPYSMVNFTFLNCSSNDDSYSRYPIPCMSNHGYQVVATYTDFIDDSYKDLVSCWKMYDIMPIPDQIIVEQRNDVTLEWFNFKPECANCEGKGKRCGRKKNSTQIQIDCFDIPNQHTGVSTKLVVTGVILGSFLLALFFISLYLFYRSNNKGKESQVKIEKFLEDYRALKCTRYSYADIKRITNQFKDKLGQGGYGTVFKGTLSNDVIVAIKILNDSKENGDEFINEVGSMGRIHHVNVTRLVGFCADGFQRALVYEFLPNESLEKYIFSSEGRRHVLGWEKLQDIALGIAKGIEYLHQGCEQRILHFDIKPHNILLDHNFNPKISDFGLAKLCSKEQSVVSMTVARGTIGYIAPEVLSRNFGNASYKSDVYSFGMLLLEIVGGRKNIENTSQVYFPEWIYHRLGQAEDLGIGIEEEVHAKIAKKITIVGLWCIQWYPVNRPSMKAVVQMLEGEEVDLKIPPNPFASKDSKEGSSIMPGPSRPYHKALEVISESE